MTERSRVVRFTPLLVLLLAGLAIYGRMLGHDFLPTWDDAGYVLDNPDIRGFTIANLRAVFSRFYMGNYAPVQMLSYMLDYSIWGLRPWGYLLTNLLLHLANGLLFYHLVQRLEGDDSWAWLAALIFLVHPVQVESVAWVSQRKNLLAMLFSLLSFHGYLRFRLAVERLSRSELCVSPVCCGVAEAGCAAILEPLRVFRYAFFRRCTGCGIVSAQSGSHNLCIR